MDINWLKRSILSILTILFFVFPTRSQQVTVHSFQHIIRWVNENNLPRYIAEQDIQDSVLQYFSVELQHLFKAESVKMPEKISVGFIEVFGKGKLAMPPASDNPKDINVSLLTFVTRATAGFAVNWKMEIIALQAGQVIYQKKKEHEIEYFSASGYMTPISWYTQEQYIALYKKFVNELLSETSLPEKIVIGTPEEREAEVRESIKDPKKAVLTSRGNFFNGGNFTMALSSGIDTLARVRFRDGGEATSRSFSGVGAGILSGLTGITFGYDSKVKVKLFGRLEYENGRSLKLAMHFMAVEKRYTDGSSGGIMSSSPMIAEAYEDEETIASFAYVNKFLETQKSMKNQLDFQVPVAHMLKGEIGKNEIYAEFDPTTNMVRVMENKTSKVVIILEPVTAGGTFSGQKMTKNKVTMMPVSKNKGEPESYNFYHQPDLTKEDLLRYMDVVMLLFFCKGNAQ